jgi:FkbM family methyltransferase
MKILRNRVLVQIGTNDGDDRFNRICRRSKPSKVILVEPFAEHNDSIRRMYRKVGNVVIENVAITESERGEVTLAIPKDRGYSNSHFSLIPMDDWGNNLEERRAPGMTFNQLCAKHGVTDIHFLQIDTEGFDAEIITSIDFSKVRIDIIKYEKWGFPTDAFSRHGEKGKSYGEAGMQRVENLLKTIGYTLVDDKRDVIAVRQQA